MQNNNLKKINDYNDGNEEIVKMRICKECGEKKEENESYFKQKNKKLMFICKDCCNEIDENDKKNRASKSKNRGSNKIETEKLKKENKARCRDCKEIKEINEVNFIKKPRELGILTTRCRECVVSNTYLMGILQQKGWFN